MVKRHPSGRPAEYLPGRPVQVKPPDKRITVHELNNRPFIVNALQIAPDKPREEQYCGTLVALAVAELAEAERTWWRSTAHLCIGMVSEPPDHVTMHTAVTRSLA
jgi:hypothetical protein